MVAKVEDRLQSMLEVYTFMEGYAQGLGENYASRVYAQVADDVRKVLDGEEF